VGGGRRKPERGRRRRARIVVPRAATRRCCGLPLPRHRAAADGDPILYRPPMPRFHVVRRIERAGDEEESLRLLTDPTFDPVSTAILEADRGCRSALWRAARLVTTSASSRRRPSTSSSTRASPARSARDRDNYFPGWRACGRPAAGAAAPRGLHAEGRADRSRRAQRRPGLRPTVLPARRRLSAAGLVLAALSLVTDRPRWV